MVKMLENTNIHTPQAEHGIISHTFLVTGKMAKWLFEMGIQSLRKVVT